MCDKNNTWTLIIQLSDGSDFKVQFFCSKLDKYVAFGTSNMILQRFLLVNSLNTMTSSYNSPQSGGICLLSSLSLARKSYFSSGKSHLTFHPVTCSIQFLMKTTMDASVTKMLIKSVALSKVPELHSFMVWSLQL